MHVYLETTKTWTSAHVGDFGDCLHNQRLNSRVELKTRLWKPEKPSCTTNQILFLKRSCVWWNVRKSLNIYKDSLSKTWDLWLKTFSLIDFVPLINRFHLHATCFVHHHFLVSLRLTTKVKNENPKTPRFVKSFFTNTCTFLHSSV
jgi:hypothetical protein